MIIQKLLPPVEDQYKAAVAIPDEKMFDKMLQDADDYAKELDKTAVLRRNIIVL